MKFIKLTLAAVCLCSLSSCALLKAVLDIPADLLDATTKSLRVGLTDEAAQPITLPIEAEAPAE